MPPLENQGAGPAFVQAVFILWQRRKMPNQNKGKMNTKRIATDAVLAAMCVALGIFSIDLGNIKLSFESFPIIAGAFLLGPLDGILIGFIGMFIVQMVNYGFSLTTALWILPYVICGAAAGLIAKKKPDFIKGAKLFASIFICELAISLFNTLAIFVDSKIYGWYYPALIAGSLLLRLACAALRTALYGIIIPAVIKAVKKISNKK